MVEYIALIMIKPVNMLFAESIDNVVERRSKEMCNLLKMLRSTSINDVDGSAYSKEAHGGWKVCYRST